jgi:hypothetical protein
MKRKKLSVEEAKVLLLLTWLEIAFAGFVIYMSINPLSYVTITIGALVFAHAILNYSEKSEYIESRIEPVVPSVFLPSMFFAILIALSVCFVNGGSIFNPAVIGIGVCALGYGICAFPESYYA